VLVSMIITFTVSLINIGSATALNAIISLVVVSLLSSYYITISCLVWRRLRGKPLPERRWSLGKYGLAINITALIFLTPVYFFAFWPAATPVQPDTMNWAVVMYVGIMICSLVYYVIWARHIYDGPPKIDRSV
jgi:choline transport protein